MPSFWIQTPPDNVLSDMRGWAQIDANKYAAMRHHLLVVETQDPKAKNGPVHKPVEWLINTEFAMEEKITNVTKYTFSIQESITSTVTTKLSQEVLAKIGLSTGLDITNLGAKLTAEMQSKLGTELVESLQNGLSTTKTYDVETKTERTKSVKGKVSAPDGSNGTREVFIYFKLNQLFWDVYLYQTDYLQLEYKERNFWELRWKDVRKTILSKEVVVKKPLFRIAYFQPVSEFSYRYDRYEPEIPDGNVILSLALTLPCPNATVKVDKSMEELAQSAFPVSKEEKRQAKERRKRPVSAASKVAARRKTGKYSGKKAGKKASRKSSFNGRTKSPIKAGTKRHTPLKRSGRKSSAAKKRGMKR